MGDHFLSCLRSTFATYSNRPALVYGERIISYGELDARAENSAALLQGLGIRPGDRVVLYTADKLPFLIAHLGVLYAGGVCVPLNPGFTRDEMRYFLADSGARVAVIGEEQRPIVEALRPELAELQAIVPDTAVLDAPRTSLSQDDQGAATPCLMIYSSGTTGWPKGVVHTQANMASALLAVQACWRFSPDDCVVNVLPLFHVHGLCFATQLSLLTGACLALERSFHPLESLHAIRRGTVFMGVPTIYYRFLQQPEFREAARSWSRLRLVTCGSAPIRAEVLPQLEAILGRPVINRYGMSEAHVITSLPLDGPWPHGSVGTPLQGIEVRVLGEDGQTAVSPAVGSVVLRGPNLFRDYWNKPEATRAAFANGWFDTGDLGYVDDNGFLTLVGRKSDLIITNGFNVYPQVVERVVNACPGVRESAVLGLPDDRRGERVIAVIVRDDPALDENRLQAHWSDRLVDYQRPVAVLFVDALPRNAMGKVLRRDLRAQVLGIAVPNRAG
jgi:malonyl-CoA/methylmalonyl-CoA synthetase